MAQKIVSLTSIKSLIQSSFVELTGTDGTANVIIDGTSYLATFNSDLTTTASDFVTTHAAAILAAHNIEATSSGIIISLKALVEEDYFTLTVANASLSLDAASVSVLDTEALKIGADSIIYVYEKGDSRTVVYNKNGFAPKEIEATESLSAISTEAANTITTTVDGISTLLNADRIAILTTEGSGSKIIYEANGFGNKTIIASESVATIESAIDAL